MHVEDCVIDGFLSAGNGNGIRVSDSDGVNLLVNNTDIHNCTTGVLDVQPLAASPSPT